jgi:hypothetical protein
VLNKHTVRSTVAIVIKIVINKWAYIQVGLYLRRGAYNCGGGLIFAEGGAYIWNEVSISTCGGLIQGGLYSEIMVYLKPNKT